LGKVTEVFFAGKFRVSSRREANVSTQHQTDVRLPGCSDTRWTRPAASPQAAQIGVAMADDECDAGRDAQQVIGGSLANSWWFLSLVGIRNAYDDTDNSDRVCWPPPRKNGEEGRFSSQAPFC
jgi:hypothetical protein